MPPDRLFWAILPDTSRRTREEALRYAFEPWLPVRLEAVEARFARAGDGTMIACGVEAETLTAWIEEQDGAVESIIPAAAPAFIPEIPLARLEFRQGAFASPRARRQDRRRHTIVAASLLLAFLLTLLGMDFRTRAALRQAEAAQQATAALIDSVVPGSPAVDPRLRLVSELRIAEQTRHGNSTLELPADRTEVLTALLAAWPDEIPCRVDRLQLDQDTLTLSGAVLQPADYQRLALALRSFSPAWLEPTGDTSRTREEYTFSLIFKRRLDMGEAAP